jgi:hypothetical protein
LHGLITESSERIARADSSAGDFIDGATLTIIKGALGFRAYCVLLPELIDTAAGIYNFLFARIEGMAVGAHFDL